MPDNHSILSFWLGITLIAAGCKHHNESLIVHPVESQTIRIIHLSPRQISRAGITYGSIIKMPVERRVNCNGKLVVRPESITCIASQASGRIARLYYRKGDLIKAGSVVATIENGDFIILQQRYLEALNQYEYARQEYARQGELTVDNATSLKKMQLAKREYQSAEINVNTYRAQLEILGLNADSITQKLTHSISIETPRSGRLYRQFIHAGSYVNKGDPLFELLDKPELMAEFQVPRKFLFQLKGSRIKFHPAYDSLAVFQANIKPLPAETGNDDQFALVYAEISDPDRQLNAGLPVKGFFSAGTDTIRTIRKDAIQYKDEKYVVYFRKKGLFQQFEIRPGMTMGDQVEMLGLPAEITDSLVVSGIGYLSSHLKTQ